MQCSCRLSQQIHTNAPSEPSLPTPSKPRLHTDKHAPPPTTHPTRPTMNVVLKGLLTWSTRLSMGPLPVAAYWAAKPRQASMARRPFLSSFRRSSLVFASDSLSE